MKERSRKKSTLTLAKLVLLLAVVTICTNTAIAATEYQWKNHPTDGSITVVLTSPAHNTYVPINSGEPLDASATDLDCERNRVDEGEWSAWYTISDEVESGTTSSNYHMWWEVSGDGEILDDDMYGTSSLYLSPDYSAGQNVRTVDICVYADDFDRNDESPTNRGYKDPEGCDWINLNVWQVPVTGRLGFDPVSSNYDGDHYSVPPFGGDQLGWLTHNDPSGHWGYRGSFEFKGSIPSGPGVTTGYTWHNHMKGIKRVKTLASEPYWVYYYNQPTYENDWASNYDYKDEDSKHPDVTGEDVREIFAIDDPGSFTGQNNNASIPPWTYIDFDMDYKCWVKLNDVRISNECLWSVKFELEEDSGTWSAVYYELDIDTNE